MKEVSIFISYIGQLQSGLEHVILDKSRDSVLPEFTMYSITSYEGTESGLLRPICKRRLLCSKEVLVRVRQRWPYEVVYNHWIAFTHEVLSWTCLAHICFVNTSGRVSVTTHRSVSSSWRSVVSAAICRVRSLVIIDHDCSTPPMGYSVVASPDG